MHLFLTDLSTTPFPPLGDPLSYHVAVEYGFGYITKAKAIDRLREEERARRCTETDWVPVLDRLHEFKPGGMDVIGPAAEALRDGKDLSGEYHIVSALNTVLMRWF